MKYQVTIGGRTRSVEIERREGRSAVTVDGVAVEVDLREVAPGRYTLLLDGKQHDATLLRGRDEVRVHLGGSLYRAEVRDARLPPLRGSGAAARPFELQAMMPGKVVRVLVEEGQHVGPEQGIVVIEAMKMENELRAAHEAEVDKIFVKPGQLVESGAALVRFRPVA